MADNKVRCALVYRLESDGTAVCVTKYDYAGQYEHQSGADSSLYGGRDKSYAEAVAGVISNDPPSGLSQPNELGGWKVVQSDQHQIVYGADIDGLCKFADSKQSIIPMSSIQKDYYYHNYCSTVSKTTPSPVLPITRLRHYYRNAISLSRRYWDVARPIFELFYQVW
jgi:hypothetical protein